MCANNYTQKQVERNTGGNDQFFQESGLIWGSETFPAHVQNDVSLNGTLYVNELWKL